MTLFRKLGAGLVLAALSLGALGDSARCLGCHDFGPESPVHLVQAGSHGSGDDATGTPGCQACHGASPDHIRKPLQSAPSVSFGPHWGASAGDQDSQCLACHEDGQAAHWKDALHMFNNLTCVTCHDIHAERDKVLIPDEQAQVCTTCHKTQKKGIHGLEDIAKYNPPCTTCHNPHDHESAETELLKNGSSGCRSCHNMERMAGDPGVPEKVKGYHRRMLQPENTCLDCHEGIAHAPADAVTAMVRDALSSKTVTLFYPGMADSDWLLQNHPGSQPLRQGRNCQQCHRGEEKSMGEVQASGFAPPTREIQVSFAADDENLTVHLAWEGPANDTDVAMMWDDGGNEAFRRGGCFAACHSDLPGMSRDRGQHTGKYLWVSRSQHQRIGQPSLVKKPQALAQLTSENNFVALWLMRLDRGTLEAGTLLEKVSWQPANLIQIKKNYKEGRWTVTLQAPLNDTGTLKPFTPDAKYTFGIALHGAGNPGGKHWVSLPMTLSFAGDETDFKVEQQ